MMQPQGKRKTHEPSLGRIHMLRILISFFLLGSASQAMGSDPGQAVTARSPIRLVGSVLVDDQTVKMIAEGKGDLQCYRSFQHNSLLRKLKCRATSSHDVLAEKSADWPQRSSSSGASALSSPLPQPSFFSLSINCTVSKEADSQSRTRPLKFRPLYLAKSLVQSLQVQARWFLRCGQALANRNSSGCGPEPWIWW